MDQKKDNPRIPRNVKGSKDVACLCGSLLLSVAFLYFVLSPLYQRHLAMEKVYVSKQNDLKGKQDLLDNIETFNRENKDLTVNSKKLVLLIPNRNNYEDFFIHLQQLSKNHNLELLSFSLNDVKSAAPTSAGTVTSTGAVITPEGAQTTPETTEPQLNQQGITLSLRGDFGNLLEFTKALENGIPFLQEDSLAVSSASASTGTPTQQPNPDSDKNPTLEIELSLRFIYY